MSLDPGLLAAITGLGLVLGAAVSLAGGPPGDRARLGDAALAFVPGALLALPAAGGWRPGQPPEVLAALALALLAATVAGHLLVRELWRTWWLGLALCLTTLTAVAIGLLIVWPRPEEAFGEQRLTWGGLASLLLLLLWQRRRARHRPRALHALALGQRRTLQAMATMLFPPLPASRYHADQLDLGDATSALFAGAPWYQRWGLGLIVELLELSPLVVVWRPWRFSRMSVAGRARVLERMEGSGLALWQLVFNLLKTVLSLQYYERDEVCEELDIRQRCMGRHREPLDRLP